jgi:hypothetical protein
MRVSQIICEKLSDEEEAELKRLKDKIANDPSLTNDSFWGPAIRRANEYFLKPDPKTNEKGPVSPQPDKRGMTAVTRKAAIDFNSNLSAKQIVWAQNALRRFGIQVVGQNGVNDETFIGAIYDFQQKSSIPPTGKYDMKTVDALKFVMKQATGSETGIDTTPQQDSSERPERGSSERSAVISAFGNTVKEFNALPGRPISVPNSGTTLKIIAKKPYVNDPETTVVLFASKSKEDNVLFGILGVNPKDKTEFILDQDTFDESRNINEMKKIYVSDRLRLKGPYTSFNGSIPAVLADELLNSPK